MSAAHQLGKQDHQRIAEIKARGYWQVDIDHAYRTDDGVRGSGREVTVWWLEPVNVGSRFRHQQFVGTTVGEAIETAHKELKEVKGAIDQG